MSSETAGRQSTSVVEDSPPPNATSGAMRRSVSAATSRVDRHSTHAPKHRVASPLTTLSAHGAPLVWLTGGALATALAMIVGLLFLILYQGLQTFWPLPLVNSRWWPIRLATLQPRPHFLAKSLAAERYRPERSQIEQLEQKSPELFAKAEAEMKAHDGQLRRQLIWTGRTATLDFAGNRAAGSTITRSRRKRRRRGRWLSNGSMAGDRMARQVKCWSTASRSPSGPEEVWQKYGQLHSEVATRRGEINSLDRHDRGAIDRRQRSARLALVGAELDLHELESAHARNQSAIENAKADGVETASRF